MRQKQWRPCGPTFAGLEHNSKHLEARYLREQSPASLTKSNKMGSKEATVASFIEAAPPGEVGRMPLSIP
jgi:hypothetical protein